LLLFKICPNTKLSFNDISLKKAKEGSNSEVNVESYGLNVFNFPPFYERIFNLKNYKLGRFICKIIFLTNPVDEESKKVLTKCYASNEPKYGWCATCNINSTKPSEPNYCSFDDEEEEDPNKPKKKVHFFI
jgi:hypothetical protein